MIQLTECASSCQRQLMTRKQVEDIKPSPNAHAIHAHVAKIAEFHVELEIGWPIVVLHCFYKFLSYSWS